MEEGIEFDEYYSNVDKRSIEIERLKNEINQEKRSGDNDTRHLKYFGYLFLFFAVFCLISYVLISVFHDKLI